MKRTLITLAILIAVLGAALPYAPMAFLKGPLEHALARGLGRKVDVDSVSLTLFSGPGFSIDGVTIHEDPRAGIEPFAYANTLDARLDPLALLRGRLEFSSLHLNDATFNLVKPDDAPWNFQLLFNQTSSVQTGAARLPALKMRGGRVNFKFGQSKSVLFFDDTDLDISPGAGGGMNLRFSGAPARTDRSAQNFGHFFVRGTSTPSSAGQRLNLRIELEPSSLDAVARLFTQSGVDLKGIVSLDAQVSGEPSRLDVNGIVQLEAGGQWRLGYKGTLDLTGQTLDLETSKSEANSPLKVHVSARKLLSRPEWDLAADLTDAPLASAVDVARKLGAPVPEKLSAAGAITGSVSYGNTDGLAGNVELRDAVLMLPDAVPLKVPTATIFLKGPTILVGPVTVSLGEAKESAEVEATYQSGEGGGLEVKISTRRMNLADMRAYGLASVPMAVPMMDRVTGGTWRGSLKYARPADDPAGGYARQAASPSIWSGEFEVQNTQVAVDGLSDPVLLQSAIVSVKPERVAVTRIKAKAGAVSFSGDYRWDAEAGKPASFRIRVEEADAKEIERLFHPTVSREGGLFARTLGLGSNDAVPEWLAKRKAEGTLAVKSLTVADTHLAGAARVSWNGPSVTISGIDAKLGDAGLGDTKLGGATLGGELRVDLSGRVPGYAFAGKLEDLAYKGGKLDFNGKLEAAGSGLAMLSSIKASGTVRGRSLALAPDSEYRRATGRFSLSMTAAGPLWKLSGLELSQGADTYAGDGVVQADGKLALDIHRN
jgi:hypothetical protein